MKDLWPTADIEMLRAAVADGKSAGECVKVFGGRYTRNALIGKVGRIRSSDEKRTGLPSKFYFQGSPLSGLSPKPRKRPPPRPAKPYTPRYQGRPTLVGLGSWRASAVAGGGPIMATATPVVSDWQPPPGRLDGVVLLERRSHECKWPIGDPRTPNFRFCGHTRFGWGKNSVDDAGHPYCEHHCSMAYGGRR